MDLMKKVELLISASTRSRLPGRGRRSILDEQEEQLLAEIRQAVAQVQTQEQALAARLKTEEVQADKASQRGDLEEQRVHERRAMELEHELEQESIQAINLEEKLTALEEKLALAKAAVEQEAQKAAARDVEADRVMAEAESKIDARTGTLPDTPSEEVAPAKPAAADTDLATRKSRLSD